MDAILNFGRWLQNTSWALSIATSDWAYPFVQLIHFSGLSLWVGTILAVDFRLLGIGKPGSRRVRRFHGVCLFRRNLLA
jgi:hypothetical protein